MPTEELIWKAEVVDEASRAMRAIEGSAKDTDRAMEQFRQRGNQAARSVAAGMATAAASMAIVLKAALDVTQATADIGDRSAKAAQQVGLSAEAYQELGHAMQLSGQDIDVLRKGLLRLARNMNDVTEGVKAPIEAFEKLGISVTDNEDNLRTMEDILPELADRFASAADGSQKAAIAMEIFGKSGADMIPFLNAGAEGIEAMRQEARELGLVLSNEAAQASEQFNDDMLRLEQRMLGLRNEIGVALLPVLNNLINELSEMSAEMLEAGTAADGVREGVDAAADAFAALAPVVTIASTTTGVLQDAFNLLDIGATSVAVTLGVLVERYYELDNAIEGSEESRRRLEEHQARLDALAGDLGTTIDEFGQATLDGVAAGDKMTSMLQRLAGAAKETRNEFNKGGGVRSGWGLPHNNDVRDTGNEFQNTGRKAKKMAEDLFDAEAALQDVFAAMVSVTDQLELEEVRSNALNSMRLQALEETNEARRVELEMTTQLLIISQELADGEISRMEAAVRRTEVEKRGAERIRQIEQDRARAVHEAHEAEVQRASQLAQARRDGILENINNAKNLGNALLGAFDGAVQGSAALDVARGLFYSAEAVGLLAINPFGAAKAGIAAGMHFAAAAQLGGGGGGAVGGGAASGGGGASSVATDFDQSKRVASEAFVEAFERVNGSNVATQTVVDFSGATFIGRDLASAQDLGDLLARNARLQLGGG